MICFGHVRSTKLSNTFFILNAYRQNIASTSERQRAVNFLKYSVLFYLTVIGIRDLAQGSTLLHLAVGKVVCHCEITFEY